MRKLSWIAVAILFYFSACTKIDSTTIGSGLIPPIDGVTTFDTNLEVFTNNFKDTSLEALKIYSTDDHVIGVINDDPMFGKTTATTYLELKPTSYKYYFPGGTTLEADSAVLILSYRGVIGDSNKAQSWVVKEVTEDIRWDTAYNVAKSFTTGNALSTPTTINIFSLNDSAHYGFEDFANQIRIKLDINFAKRLMEQYDSTAGKPYESDSLFKAAFKGFAITPADGSGGNALVRVNLSDTNTKLALFYRFKDSEAKSDTAVSYFRFSNGTGVVASAQANYIKRDFTGSQVSDAWNNVSSNSTYSYIQTAPGTFSTIKIPALDTFSNSIIHRAELLVYQDKEDEVLSNVLTPPQFLLLSSYDSAIKVKTNVRNDFIVSSGVSNPQTFGGYLMQKDVSGYKITNAYTFDLTRYVQGIVTRKDTNNTLRISAPVNDSLKYSDPYPAVTTPVTFYIQPSIANNPAEGRVRLGGGASATPQIRMRLHIIFSKI